MDNRQYRKIRRLLTFICLFVVLVFGLYFITQHTDVEFTPPTVELPVGTTAAAAPGNVITLETLPEYEGLPYCALYDNIPEFPDAAKTTQAFETYADLDRLGRCGVAYACVGQELMPTEDRESISSVTPSGWVNVPYSFVDGGYLYNRCHLIGFQLTGENANERNLITGTRYLNIEGMLPFENMVADYVQETGNHVLYRVTPIFEGTELVARGVQLEAWSVEDDGAGVCFNIYAYNVQPGVAIDYASGESRLDEAWLNEGEQRTLVLNTSSKRYHEPDCKGAASIKDTNREDYTGTIALLEAQGYKPCSQCVD